jgi:hypothetical protein
MSAATTFERLAKAVAAKRAAELVLLELAHEIEEAALCGIGVCDRMAGKPAEALDQPGVMKIPRIIAPAPRSVPIADPELVGTDAK